MCLLKVLCTSLVLLIAMGQLAEDVKEQNAINTFRSNNTKLMHLRQPRSVKANIISLRHRLRKLITRRKLHYQRLKTTKKIESATRLKIKVMRVQEDIKKVRRWLRNERTKFSNRLKSPNSSHEAQLSKVWKNPSELRELHEKCKNLGCTQLCTPEIGHTASWCHCHRGFYLNSTDNRTCLDINECKLPAIKCEYKCVNTIGSYYCTCPFGKKLSHDKATCIDINECFLNNNHGPCQDVCVNTAGSYSCACDRFQGTRLGSNGHSCEDIDECSDDNVRAECSHDCFNVYNSFVCGCPDGMLLGDDWKTCNDVNECLDTSLQSETGKCINTIGSYFRLDGNNPGTKYLTCEHLPPTTDGYYLCDRNKTVAVILKGITDREHFLNVPGTVCTYYSSLHMSIKSYVCNDRAKWEPYPLTVLNRGN